MKKLLTILTLCVAVTFAKADPIEIPGDGQDIPKNGTGIGDGNSNNDDNNFFRLQGVVAAYNAANPGANLPTPDNSIIGHPGTANVTGGGLAGFDYAVLHYGAGPDGTSGGGIAFYYLNGATDFNFPADGLGPNGFGGFSSIVLFGSGGNSNVPDAANTLLLLGVGLIALKFASRRLRTA